MKNLKLYMGLILTLSLPNSSFASNDRSLENCEALAEIKYSYERSQLESERNKLGSDSIAVDIKIQRLNMEIAGAKALCKEPQTEFIGKARPDDEYKHPRRMDDEMSEVEFENSQYYPPEE